VLNAESAGTLAPSKQAATAIMLENQKRFIESDTTNISGGVAKWDPILIGMVRRMVPKLIAFDIAGVQPMTGPTGLVFTLRSRYGTQGGAEAFISEFKPGSGTGTQNNTIFGGDFGGSNPVDFTTGYLAAIGESLGTASDGSNAIKEMAFTIDKYSIIADTRKLRARWSTELEQDMRAIHGLSAEDELVSILNTEIAGELNREILRKMYFVAKLGCAHTTNAGIFDLNADSNGRWAVERFKGLMFQIEIERNAIMTDSRRGKGNYIVTTSNVASALAMTGLLDSVAASKLDTGLVVDITAATYAGNLVNGLAVYVDPYGYEVSGGVEFVMVGYKGQSAADAAMIYSPYMPIELTKVVDPNSFQPAVGMQCRQAISNQPMETGSTAINSAAYRSNPLLRIFKVVNLTT
jgi:hypothetical protein